MTSTAKRRTLFAVSVLFVIAALYLVATRFFPNAATPTPKELADRAGVVATLQEHAKTLAMLKAKCGLETKIENETSCECDAETRTNRQVDEIEELIASDPTIEYMEFEFPPGHKTTAHLLIGERLPKTPGCQPQ